MASALDDTKKFWDYNKDGKTMKASQPAASKLIEPFLKDKNNPKAQALTAYLSSTNRDSWDTKMIEAIAQGTTTFHVGSTPGQPGSGQSGSGQQGGFFLSALAGVAIPAIISAMSGSGGSGFSPYKPKKQKNQYAYLK